LNQILHCANFRERG